jgi:intraflagellar transport protein 122
MNTKSIWSDHVPARDGLKSTINDLAISPDGSRLVVAVGNRVLLYNFHTGDLIESLRAHKEIVTCVDFSFDGTRFASGGSDNLVIIWKSSGQGLLKYTHAVGIQRVSYSPTNLHLLSCSENDFGMWSPEQKQVSKESISSKILSAAWAPNGSLVALGLENGCISIRKPSGEEVQKIERKAPIFCIKFLPPSTLQRNAENTSTSSLDIELVVGCWDKTLSTYRFYLLLKIVMI